MSAAARSLARWISQNVAKNAMLPVLGRTSPERNLPAQWIANGPGGYLYRGLRYQNQAEALPDGSLVLHPGTNFGGKTVGISFAEDPSIALEYATRTGGPIWGDTRQSAGALVRIPFSEVSQNPRLAREAMGETAIYQDFPLVVPAKRWEVGYLDDQFSNAMRELSSQARRVESAPIEELVERRALETLSAYNDYFDSPRTMFRDSPNIGTIRWVSGTPRLGDIESSMELARIRGEASLYPSFDEFIERLRSGLYGYNEELGYTLEELGSEIPFWKNLQSTFGGSRPISSSWVPY